MGLKPTLNRYNDVEPVLGCDFAVMFPDMPQLGYLAASTAMPGFSIERMHLDMFGRSREFPGRKTSTHTLPISFLYDRKSAVFRTLLGLINAASDSTTGTWLGRPFSIIVEQYDSVGELVQARYFRNCWMQELSEYMLDATQDQAVMAPAVFYYERQDIVFGDGAVIDPRIPLNVYQSYGKNPHDLLREAEDIIRQGADTIAGVIRTGSEALAYGRAALNATSQLARLASNVVPNARSNPLAAVSQAVNTVRQVSNVVRSILG